MAVADGGNSCLSGWRWDWPGSGFNVVSGRYLAENSCQRPGEDFGCKRRLTFCSRQTRLEGHARS
jgi:hypothetical protein